MPLVRTRAVISALVASALPSCAHPVMNAPDSYAPAAQGGSANAAAGLAPGTYLVAIDTSTRTYVDYVQVGANEAWSPAANGWPSLAQWDVQTAAQAVRFMPFKPGDAPSAADIVALLPATRLAAQTIDITAAPYGASPTPADATAAIQAALKAAGARASASSPVDVVVPPGTYDVSAVLEVGAYVRLRGAGGVLQATRPATSAVHLGADGSAALFLTLVSHGTARSGEPDASGIWVGPRTAAGAPVHDTLVVGNEIVQPSGAHVFAVEEVGGLWAFNYAHDGYADTFHHTGRSSECQVIGNRASGAPGRGDDLYAFVGYGADGDPVHHCTCIANWGRDANARGISVIGAGYVAMHDNDIARTQAAGVYVAQENAWSTFGSFNVAVLHNAISQANLGSSHDGVLAFSDAPSASASSATFGPIPNAVRNLTVSANTITQVAPGIGNGFGIEVRSSCQGGTVSGNTVSQATAPGIVVKGADFTMTTNTVSP